MILFIDDEPEYIAPYAQALELSDFDVYISPSIHEAETIIQSDPDKTFLHPELNKRFLHNIGPGGKSKYATWETYADQDEYFKMLNGSPEITPEEIQEIRQKLIDIRNKS
mgnify:CR=1 FL=1